MSIGNQTLGRGKVYVSLFKPGGYIPAGYRYIGNTPSFNVNIQNATLDHFSSDEGVKEKDKSIILQTTSTGSLTCDDIQPENLALFFFGSASVLAQTAAVSQTETFADVTPGQMYRLGMTDQNPSGVRQVSNVVVTGQGKAVGTITFAAQPTADTDTVTVNGTAFTAKTSGATGNQFNIGGTTAITAANLAAVLNASVVAGVALATYTVVGNIITVTYDTYGTAGNAFTLVKSGTNPTLSGAVLAGGAASAVARTLGTDYTVDLVLGAVTILDTGAVGQDEDVVMVYDRAAVSRKQVISGSNQVQGSIMFIADNPEGENQDYLMPYVRLSPNGDYDLKGDTWLTLPLNVEILKAPNRERIYLDGRPF